MRSYLPDFELTAPSLLKDVLELLSTSGGRVRPFAGGTDLMVLLESGKLAEGPYVGLWNLADLRGIEDRGDAVVIGAMTTYTDILSSQVIRAEFPLLCRAAEETGGIATQNRGTIGGNIANGSPAADTPPALFVYDAELELASTRGSRRVPYDRFHTGYKKMDLAADELIVGIRLPKRTSPWRQYYRKVGTRRAQAISKVCLATAVSAGADERIADIRIALGSVAPMVIRAHRAEAALRGRAPDTAAIRDAQDALVQDISPIDDIRSTAKYRLRVAQGLLEQSLA